MDGKAFGDDDDRIVHQYNLNAMPHNSIALRSNSIATPATAKLLYDNRIVKHHNSIATRYIASASPVRRIAIANPHITPLALKNDAG